jgi:hypothetical protein
MVSLILILWLVYFGCDTDTDDLLYRHFNGEESFDTGPMAPASEPAPVKTGTKL